MKKVTNLLFFLHLLACWLGICTHVSKYHLAESCVAVEKCWFVCMICRMYFASCQITYCFHTDNTSMLFLAGFNGW